jgi:hypothetical protein
VRIPIKATARAPINRYHEGKRRRVYCVRWWAISGGSSP